MKNTLSHILASALLVCILGIVPLAGALAQNTAGTSNQQPSGAGTSNERQIVPLKNPLKVNSVAELITTFVTAFSYLVILLAVLLLVWVGFQFIMARGNADKIGELREWLMWIVIGVAVVLGARIIISVVINTLGATGAVDPGVIQSARDAAEGR